MSYNNGEWSVPRRMSENVGPPDAGYAILPSNDGLIGLFPVCDNNPGSRRTFNHRIEIHSFGCGEGCGEGLEDIEVTIPEKGFYILPFGIESPAPDPPSENDGLGLIWGDIHSHSFNSKCICSINGSPEDMLRYQRDILGCSVLTLTDHTHHMGAQEFVWQLDILEAFAGENRIVLYSCEPGTRPGHHTNFYAFDRGVFERLRPIVLAYWDRDEMYSAIKERLPKKSVLALRHFHGFTQGPYGINGKKTAGTWDPDLEIAMEAMQVRGNILLGEGESPAQFPANFLDAGATIGLVGGSDHSTGKSPNHFCLTGFWVEERSARGVWEALINRRTVACSNGKISVWTDLEGLPMGSKASISGSVAIDVRLAAARPIRRIGLMRDGEILEWVSVQSNSAQVTFTDVGPSRLSLVCRYRRGDFRVSE